MDIWEANSISTAYTLHPCNKQGQYTCSGVECGDSDQRYQGVCDKDGCDYNGYRMGNHTHYGAGPNFALDTSKVITVVTQFITDDGTDEGSLVEIRRHYIQDGKVIPEVNSTIPGVEGNSVTDAFCTAQKEAFSTPDDHAVKGGLKSMGAALDRGLVLVLSLWDDGATEMRWLDAKFPKEAPDSTPGALRGPCDGSTSNPNFLRSNNPSATVKYMNIRYGDIGSTTTAPSSRRLSPIVG